MNGEMVAHKWTHGIGDKGLGSNLSYEGGRLYSYEAEIARIVVNEKGEKAYIVSTMRYSNTTARHQRYAIMAIPEEERVFVTNMRLGCDPMAYAVEYVRKLRDDIRRYKRAISDISRDVRPWETYGNLKKYMRFFGLGTLKGMLRRNADWWNLWKKYDDPADGIGRIEYAREMRLVLGSFIDHEELSELGTVNVVVDDILGAGTWKRYIGRIGKRADREKKKQENAKSKFKESLLKWKRGEINSVEPMIFGYGERNAWLRLRDGMIQTSKGIRIGIEEARRLWAIVKAFHEGMAFRHDLVLDLGGNKWKINKYENDMMTAGCHTIPYSEMEEMARQLNLV